MNTYKTYKPEPTYQLSQADLDKISQGLIARQEINNFEKLITSDSNALLLVDKIAKTILIDSNFKAILPFLHSAPMVNGKYIEEGNLRHQKPIKFTGKHDNLEKLLPSPIPTALTLPGERYMFKTTIESQMYNTAATSSSQVASYLMLQMKRHVDNQILFLNAQIKEFIGQTLNNVLNKYNTAKLFDPLKDYDLTTKNEENQKLGDLTYVKDSDGNLGVVVKEIKKGDFPSFVSATGFSDDDLNYEAERGSIAPLFLKTETECPGTGETDAEKSQNAAKFLLNVGLTIQSLATDSSAYNLAGQITSQTTINNMFMVIDASILPYIQAYLANVLHTDKMQTFLSIPIIALDTIGSQNRLKNVDIIGGIIDNRGIKVIPNYALSSQAYSASGDYRNFYTHTQNTFWRSFITNINVIVSTTGFPNKRLLNKYLYYKESELLNKEIAELKIEANKINDTETKNAILNDLDGVTNFNESKAIFTRIKEALESGTPA